MSEPRPPPYEHTDPQHPGSECPGCTPLSHELEYLRARLASSEAERERLAERVHKAEGMANEINILIDEVRDRTAERDAARGALRDLVVWGEWIRKHIHRTPRMDEPNTGALSGAREALAAGSPESKGGGVSSGGSTVEGSGTLGANSGRGSGGDHGT